MAAEAEHGESSLAPLPVPSEHHSLAVSHLDASAPDVAYLYGAYAPDRKKRDVRSEQIVEMVF